MPKKPIHQHRKPARVPAARLRELEKGLVRRGRGRPTDLTPELLDAICLARARGMSITKACRANFTDPDRYHVWVKLGEADIAQGKNSIYAEFAGRVPGESARGEFVLREVVFRGALTGERKDVDAAKAALAALAQQEAGRRGSELRGKGQAPAAGPPPPATQSPARPVDLGRLSADQRDLFRQLLRIARGEASHGGG